MVFNRTCVSLILLTTLTTLIRAHDARADSLPEKIGKVWVVPVSHLDTQWRWTVKKSITDYIPGTFDDVADRLDALPWFQFGWEGAFRYMLLKEYYPELFERIRKLATEGRWKPQGSTIEAGDVNIPSPESIFRQILYGNQWFEQNLGASASDLFLPDCFGFGWALPSIAAHSGLIGLSSFKLQFHREQPVPFDVGRWSGPDGKEIVAALKPGVYTTTFDSDISNKSDWISQIEILAADGFPPITLKYFGVGDTGGCPDSESLSWLEKSVDGQGPLEIIPSTSEDFFKSMSNDERSLLPDFSGELLMRRHGTGAYTAHVEMKRLNRRNELLADAAEKASVAAELFGNLPWQSDRIKGNWIRFLWHQFHDDITGTSIPEVYEISQNDEFISAKGFAGVLEDSMSAISGFLDTTTEGVPLVVFNSLSHQRKGIVEAEVIVPCEWDSIVVADPWGREVPSQITSASEGVFDILFEATVPSVGFAVFEVLPGHPKFDKSGVHTDGNYIENDNLRITVNSKGDVSSLFDKRLGLELLSSPSEMQFLDDNSTSWPAWEITFDDLMANPYATSADSETVSTGITENGPLRASLVVNRTIGSSSFIQTISLTSSSVSDVVRVDNDIDWHEKATILKASLPLTMKAEFGTWDLGLGTIDRPPATPDKYEVPGQQWADLTDSTIGAGVSILSDSRYGWDMPDNSTLRLTVFHTPKGNYLEQASLDQGRHVMAYGIFPHSGNWTEGTTKAAESFNQPLMAFQPASKNSGKLRSLSLAGTDGGEIAIKATKKSEDSTGYVIRLQETSGAASHTTLYFGLGIEKAMELDGQERTIGALKVADGRIDLDFSPWETRTILIMPVVPESVIRRLDGARSLALNYDSDVVTENGRTDGSIFDKISIPAELFPKNLDIHGIRFLFGPSEEFQNNAVTCSGGELPVNGKKGETVHLLIASGLAGSLDFKIGDQIVPVDAASSFGIIGKWNDGPQVEKGELAWTSSHSHQDGSDRPYEFVYVWEIDIFLTSDTETIQLPEAAGTFILSGSVSSGVTTIKAATTLFDGHSRTADGSFRRAISHSLELEGHADSCPGPSNTGCQSDNSGRGSPVLPLSLTFSAILALSICRTRSRRNTLKFWKRT